MSLTFTLTSNKSILSVDFHPEIVLNESYQYALALLSFHTYNSIPNIEEGINNRLYFSTENSIDENIIDIPTGSYELSDLESFLVKELCRRGCIPNSENKTSYFSLKPNNNTLKCELASKFRINFTKQDSLGKLLGFTERILNPNEEHQSDAPVNIIKVITVRIECNIITGSFYDNKRSHTLYEFAPLSDPGYSLNIEPNNLIYLPVVNSRSISNITLKILDQDGELVNFRGENIIIRLQLKKVS